MSAKQKNKPNELYITRVFDAPVKVVWEAWADPEQKAHWWGPRGFTITTHSSDFRTGGAWNYTMHGPDGVDYPNTTKYLEVEKYSRMVYDHGGHEDRPPMFRVTVSFTETKGKTLMEMTMALPTEEAAKEAKKFIKKAGGDSTWDRLAEYVAPSERFVINRSFEAPRDLVFKMWTDPRHFAQWLPPAGMTMELIKAEIKAGGTSFFAMTGGGMKMFGKIAYKEITPTTRLVYTQIFCDEKGNISRHPKAPTWPETMLTTITFSDEDPDRTRVTVCWEIYGEATAAERECFLKERGGMTQGWTGSFDKLEELLKSGG